MFQRPEGTKLLKDELGKWRKDSLFWEKTTPPKRKLFTPLYTLKEEDYTDEDGITYPSARRIYLELGDPTEYAAAMALLGSWEHWKVLTTKCKWFMDEVEKWREELEIKLKSKALKAMIHTATEEGSKGTAAAKYIVDKGWIDTRGRPSKKAVQKEARIQNRVRDELEEDFERMKEHMH